MELRTPGQVARKTPLVIEAAGQKCKQTTQFIYLGGAVNENGEVNGEIDRRGRLAWGSMKKYGRELYDQRTAPLKLKVRMLKAEVMETLLYGCVTWTLCQDHYAKLRTVHHQLLLRIIGFQRRRRTDHVMYAKALEITQCESVETIIRKRRLLFAGAVARQSVNRLPRRVILGKLLGGENPAAGRPPKNWNPCLVDDLQAFQATHGCTENAPLVFGVKTVLWTTAAKNPGRWLAGVTEGADGFMDQWFQDNGISRRVRHRKEAEKATGSGSGRGGKHHAKEAYTATSSAEGRGGGWYDVNRSSSNTTAVD